jgi:hypothetical protein
LNNSRILSSAGFFPITGGNLQGSTILRNVNNSNLIISAGIAGNTTAANLNLFGKDETTYPGYFFLTASDGTNIKELIGRPDGTLIWNNNDLAGSVIVKKLLSANGYIKYASGLILQWGGYDPPSGTNETEYSLTVPFNVSFTTKSHQVVCSHKSDSINNPIAVITYTIVFEVSSATCVIPSFVFSLIVFDKLSVI